VQPDLGELEKRLWDAADELRANSGLKSSEYGTPVLGLIFLRFAETKFDAATPAIAKRATARRPVSPGDYHALGVVFVTAVARFSHLLGLPEGADLGQAVNRAMAHIEDLNPDLSGVMPRTYTALDSSTIASLLRQINSYTKDLEGDAFGLVYEYFLAKFAIAEGSGAGEFFTPMSVVRLIVEIIEPFHGRIFDPACGSGGMFVHSAHFVERHRRSPGEELSIYGQEKTGETVRLARMNLAIHGLSGEIREGNSYYDDLHHSFGRFDFVMANPPFNVDRVDKAKLEGDPRFPALPRADNANYLWIQLFATALNETGRAGFVMPNSSTDVHAERQIRRGLIENRLVDAIVSIGPNFFYTVPLSVTLWFLDRQKSGRADQVLFIDARQIFRQVDRAHRDFTEEQLELLANIVRLHRGETPELNHDGDGLFAQLFPERVYADIPGLCKVATIDEIEVQAWSLSPGRYVGTKVEDLADDAFQDGLATTYAELRELGIRADGLQRCVDQILSSLLRR
jgi:type I restriction enzyme M protein